MKKLFCLITLFLSITGIFSQKINVEKYRPAISDSSYLQSGFQYIEGNDSIHLAEVVESLTRTIRQKTSSESSLMTASLLADEMVDQGQIEQAYDLLIRTGSEFRSRYDTLNMAWAFYHKSMAYYHYQKANYKKRVAHHQAEIDIVSQLDEQHPLLIEIYSQLMTAHWSARNVKDGFACYDKVLRLASEEDYDYYRVNAYLNAVNIIKFYKPSVAGFFAEYTNYLAEEKQKSYFFDDPYFFISLGSAHTAINKHQEALELYHKGLDVFRSSGARNPVFLASLYYYIGVSHKNLVYHNPDTSQTGFHHQQADVWLDSARVIAKERMGTDHPMYSRVINLKGQNLNNWKKYEEALPINEKAWQLVEKQHGRYNKYYSQQAINELGRSQLRSGRHKEALETFHRQICYFLETDDTLDVYNTVEIDTARFVDSHEELMRALSGKARALEFLMGDTVDTAMVALILDHYEQALAVTDARASGAVTTNGLMWISANFEDIGKRIIDFLCRYNFSDEQVERVYRLVSESKAHALLAGMYRSDLPGASDEDSTTVKIDQLQAQMQRLDASGAGDEYEALMEHFLELQKQQFVSGLGKATKVESIRLPRLANVEDRPVNYGIKPDETVIDYFVTSEFLCRFEISTDGIRYYSQPYSSDLKKQTGDLFRAVKTGDNSMVRVASEKLFKGLLSDDLLTSKKLTIIPHGKLYQIPFEILNSGSQEIIRSSSVAYRYTSHLYTRQREPIENELRELTMFAPVFDDRDLAFNQAAEKRGMEVDTTDLYRSGNPGMLKSIPYTMEELEQVSTLFSKSNRTTRLFSRNQASEAKFKEEAGDAEVLHLATHGHADMQNPGNSGLFFAPDEKEDGFLFMDEIFDLDLQAHLVVLSACKSGTGEIVKGEGVMALPRGFIHAGVPNVVASMWKVHDARTKELMVAFYQYLLSGHSYNEALRLAKIKCMDKSFLPVDWAGFILVEG